MSAIVAASDLGQEGKVGIDLQSAYTLTGDELMDLNGIETTLSGKRAELMQRIAAVERDFNAGRSIDSEEQAAELENEEVLIGLQQEAQKELQNVDTALLKLQQGRYDVCSSCGGKISQDRLEALPYVIDCINCAN